MKRSAVGFHSFSAGRHSLKLLRMVFVRRICVALMTLVLGTRAFCAAAVTERTFEMASKAFADMFWENAEEDFGNFVRDHRDSPRVPEAILYQAEARFYMHRYSDAVSLLSTNQANAGTLGDLYLYWIAESQYQNSNYTAAADAFGRVARLFSGSTNRLRASVGEAAAFAQSDQWSRTIELLQDSGGVFQQLSKTVPNDNC